jgi:hypothetical protein
LVVLELLGFDAIAAGFLGAIKQGIGLSEERSNLAAGGDGANGADRDGDDAPVGVFLVGQLQGCNVFNQRSG